MGARGNVAKQTVSEKIKKIFGSDYVGESGGKMYVWADDGVNGKIQLAIALTAPKQGLEIVAPETHDDWDWSESTVPEPAKPANEITKEELDNIDKLIANLGL